MFLKTLPLFPLTIPFHLPSGYCPFVVNISLLSLGLELVTWVTVSRLFFQRKQKEIQVMKHRLTKIQDLGENLEEALILDIKYSTIGLAQQWDQLYQLGMRMQHNLEQQIQAKY